MNCIFVSIIVLYILGSTGVFVTASGGFKNARGENTYKQIEISPNCAAVALVGGGAIKGAEVIGFSSSYLITQLGTAGQVVATWWNATMSLIDNGNFIERFHSIALSSKKQYVWEHDLGGPVNAECFKIVCKYIDEVDPETSAGKAVDVILRVVQGSSTLINMSSYASAFWNLFEGAYSNRNDSK